MIKVDKGIVELAGSVDVIPAELICAIKAVYESLEEHYGEEYARELIDMCYADAFKSEEQIKAETARMVIDNLFNRLFGGM